MCGIVGYVGEKNALPIVLKGLKRLEYRGYDSAGVSVLNDSKVLTTKTAGKVTDLEAKLNYPKDSKFIMAMGHTRWATHGIPNDVNAHPHTSNSGELTIVHNGIIENYEQLKTLLIDKGYQFFSETDTEVLVNFIEYIQKTHQVKISKAVQLALKEVIGAYAICVIDSKCSNEMVVARLGSPLAIGIGNQEFFIGSDATPFLEFTNRTVYLEDGELAIINKDKELEIRKIQCDTSTEPKIIELEIELDRIEKGGFEDYMLKEIYEQPTAITDTLRGRLTPFFGDIHMSGINNHLKNFLNARRIIIIGCGTSWHAGLIGEYLIEEFANIPVEVEYASEFRYRNPIIYSNDIIISISQSVENADALAAIKMAKEKGAFVFSVCNVPGSSIARLSHAGAYTHAGPEIGVASTKAFTTQVTVLAMIALKLAKEKSSLPYSLMNKYLFELNLLATKIELALQANDQIKSIASYLASVNNCLYLGRGYNFPLALEGALKLKEISYIHAEGYPAAEMKHGPIALIDKNMPVIVIAPRQQHYEKIVSNIQEIKAREGVVIAVVTEGDDQIKNMADYTIEIPHTMEAFSSILAAIPLQLLSYHVAKFKGCNVDQPRNLAKSVTVE